MPMLSGRPALDRGIELAPLREKAREMFRANPSLQPLKVATDFGLSERTVATWKKRALAGIAPRGWQRVSPKPEAGKRVIEAISSLSKEGKDPRLELWDAIWEVILSKGRRITELELTVTDFKTRDVEVRTETQNLQLEVNILKRENQDLQIQIRSLQHINYQKLLEQAKNALATPGEGSLIS